jgi:pre-mRNA-splicing factor CWC22
MMESAKTVVRKPSVIIFQVLEVIRLNEDDTTSASRIFIKVLFQELSEYLGLPKLNDRLKDP